MSIINHTGAKKTITLSTPHAITYYIVPTESIQALPTSKPATPQISFTTVANDIPLITPEPNIVSYSVVLYAWGMNNATGATRALNHGMYINTGSGETEVISGSGNVTVNTYWTTDSVYASVSKDDVVGSTYNVYLWDTDGMLDYRGYMAGIYPTKIAPIPDAILYDVSYTNIKPNKYFLENVIDITTETPSPGFMYFVDEVTTVYQRTAFTKKVQYTNPYLFKEYYFDGTNSNKTIIRTSAAAYPYYDEPVLPTTITYRVGKTDKL